MPYEELLGWFSYLEQRPVDWRSDDRAYKILRTQGVKEKPWQVFQALDPIYNSKKSENNGFDTRGFKSSALFHKMLGAKKGDSIHEKF